MNKKDIFDEMEEQNEPIKVEKTEIKISNKNYFRLFLIILSFILLTISGYNLFLNINKTDDINLYYLIINNSIICLVSLFVLLSNLFKKTESIFKTLLIISLISFVSFNILIDNKIIEIDKQKQMPNLVGMLYDDVNAWAEENNILINTTYEYSDDIEENRIINQNITTNTLLKKVKEVNLLISSGPNYDKSVIISNMVGWNIDDALKETNKNLLNNVSVEYIKNNDYDKDIIVEQNIKGNIRRNDKLILTVSLGNILDKIPMIDVKDKSLFDLELWLKRNGIKYNLEYVYSDNVKRNDIISCNKNKDEEIDIEKDKLNIIISKGKAIIVPNIIEMNVNDLNKWINENNLKIEYKEQYDANIPLGGIIDCNYNENDEIEEEALIKVITSKGPLKMESFTLLNDFRSWAEKYKVKYREEYQYSDTVSKGKIIKFSLNKGDIIKNNQSITVYISKGKSITIPNFVGKSKTETSKICYNLGLNCSFTYGSYSSTPKDNVTSQNKKSGLTVVSGTSISLTLSKGPANSCNIYIQPTWYGSSADATISSLKNKLTSELKNKGCSDVNFTYKKKCYNSYPSGYIPPDSPTKGGNNTFTEGKTYTIYISDTGSC